MQVCLSSDGYNIVSSGHVFLFGAHKDLTIHILADNGFVFDIRLEFAADDAKEHRVEKTVNGNTITLMCYNFKNSGTGLTKPVRIAQIEEKDVFLMFWSYLEGAAKGEARSVKYTIFVSGDQGECADGK